MSRTTNSFDERLRSYVLSIEPTEHKELCALRESTALLPNARYQIAPEQGCLLAFLVRLLGASRTLEIGTFTGYSALAVALALPAGGQVIACEIDEQSIDIGRPFWERAGVIAKIDVKLGPAKATLALLDQSDGAASFDFAFIDANKEEYDSYYESALRLVKPGGLIVLDNVLFRGAVANAHDVSPLVASIQRLNMKIAVDERVDHVVLPVGDGVTLARRRY